MYKRLIQAMVILVLAYLNALKSLEQYLSFGRTPCDDPVSVAFIQLARVWRQEANKLVC